MKRISLLVVVLLVVIGIAAVPVPRSKAAVKGGVTLKASATVTVTAPDLCQDCADQCWNEANNTAYNQCRDNGGSQSDCYSVTLQYYNNCITVICNAGGACNIKKKLLNPYRNW